MRKRRTPLQVLWRSVRVWSCADGRIHVMPEWRTVTGRAGLFDRLYAARQLERVIDMELRGGRR